MKSLSRVWLFTTPRTAAHQDPPSMGFSRQEHWSGLPLPTLKCYVRYIQRNHKKMSSNSDGRVREWCLKIMIYNLNLFGKKSLQVDLEKEGVSICSWPMARNHFDLYRPLTWCSERLEEKETTEAETVGWHHQLNGHEFEQSGEGQGSLACCSPWRRKASDRTEQLNTNRSNNL